MKRHEKLNLKHLSFKRRIAIRGKRIFKSIPEKLHGLVNFVTAPVIKPMYNFVGKEYDASIEKKWGTLQKKIDTKKEDAWDLNLVYDGIDYASQEEIYQAYMKDINDLEKKQLKLIESPRKLLVSRLFLTKLTKRALRIIAKPFAFVGRGAANVVTEAKEMVSDVVMEAKDTVSDVVTETKSTVSDVVEKQNQKVILKKLQQLMKQIELANAKGVRSENAFESIDRQEKLTQVLAELYTDIAEDHELTDTKNYAHVKRFVKAA